MPTFRELHKPGDPFILANAWDVGSAKMLAAMGAQALATSSAAYAFTLGVPDGGQVSLDAHLAHAQDLVAATDLPVSGDMEDGYGPSPEDCEYCVRLSAEAGLAGICIEDTIGASAKYYDFDLAVERVRAASAAARALADDFFFVARADGVMTGGYDIEEALRRVKAFDAAGADGIYVPLPKSFDDLKRIVAATDKPVNVLAAGPYAKFSRADYAKAGLARISLGSALARVTHRAIHDAAQAMFGEGDFGPLTQALPGSVVDPMLGE